MAVIKLADGRSIGDYQQPYIVAEVNSSHSGNLDSAKEMITMAKEVGCHCVKFQSWSPETLYSESYYEKNRMAKRIVKKFALSEEDFRILARHAKDTGIAFSSTPYSRREVDFLVEECHVPFLKIASMELNNYHFLEYIASRQLPVILSTGMGTMEEIEKAVQIVEGTGNRDICILHCVSEYPVQSDKVNLNNIIGLRERFPEYPIGYSDHTLGYEVAAAATALGAAVIEKHVTLDRAAVGMDNQMATQPEEMKELTAACRSVCEALGSKERVIYEEDEEQKRKMRRSVVAARDLEEGTVLKPEDLDVKRPGDGIPADRLDMLTGRRILRAVKRDHVILEEDIEEESW